MAWQWSQMSLDLFDAYMHSKDNLIVQAVPGAGKTRNLEELWGMDTSTKLYLVFNTAPRDEARAKLKPLQGSDISTLNGLGHRAIMQAFGDVHLDGRKVIGIIREHVPMKHVPFAQRRERQWALNKAVETAKRVCTDVELQPEVLDHMVYTYDLECYSGMYEDARRVLELSDDMVSVIDYGDQVRLPALYDIPLPRYDVVLGDESQDFSPIQALLISRLQAGRYVFVGDRNQSMYGFNGAMNNSLDYLKEQFNCREMPLSITYRCAKSIVSSAQQLYPQIQPWDQSPEGMVRGLDNDELPQGADTLVVCRNNAPVIELAYKLLGQGIPCHVRGRDIAEGLVSLIKKQQASSVRQLLTSLELWYELERQKALAREDERKLQSLDDKYNSLLLFISKCNPDDHPDNVIEVIQALFDNGRGVCLSTVHKAKGMEAHSVYVLQPGLFTQSQQRCKQPWQRIQERNIHYVALTRAKRQMIYMP